MSELVNKLVNDSINPDRTAHELELCIRRVFPDKVISVEVGEVFPSNTTGQLLAKFSNENKLSRDCLEGICRRTVGM